MSEDVQYRLMQRKLLQNPKAVLAGARKGSQMEIMVLSNAWTMPPGVVSLDEAMDVFLLHLQEKRVPSNTADKFCHTANLAFASMVGLSKAGPLLPEDGPLVQMLLDAWPGIYKWSVYLFSTRIEGLERTDTRRRATLDVLSAFWYTIEHRDCIREAMVKSPGTIEIATRLWLEEDGGPIPTTMDSPAGTCVLGNMLKFADKEALNRVLRVAGGKAGEVAKLSIARLQRALKGPEYNAIHITIYMDFINSISRVPSHPLRHALLSANIIWVVTTALTKISVLIHTSRDPGFLTSMVAAFGYLRNCLESTEGFTWVAQSVGAGLLQAICDCSPRFRSVDPDDYVMIKDTVGDILPRYLVFRTVIEAVETALNKIEHSPQKKRVEESIIWPEWKRFTELARERVLIMSQIDAFKGHSTTCDNIQCQKVGPREMFRRCSACLTTFYCSKECQAVAWKEGDHKTMCKLKQRERAEGRSAPVSKRDYQFAHYFSMFDARMHIAELRRAARRDFPHTPLHELVISIDHTTLPPTYGVKDLKTYRVEPLAAAAPGESTMALEARNDALIEKVQQHPDRFTLVEMAVPAGQGTHIVLALATGELWGKEDADEDEPDVLSRALGPKGTLHGGDAKMRRIIARLMKVVRDDPVLKGLLSEEGSRQEQ
ncbi:hypothetical protein PYCCODRAFT_1468190 [Trametes coccinea BRFM310]|uniref:MYND-type domain-containing protein n=1 Tax=Trametes coccinea (strain BRFM310) TaxID=1353009 RepID=A0A1Y2IL86_TRAC3|nr:hypothetical protein PYCCODRAFT_1468190 [Trametes coccinea BRFM310]